MTHLDSPNLMLPNLQLSLWSFSYHGSPSLSTQAPWAPSPSCSTPGPLPPQGLCIAAPRAENPQFLISTWLSCTFMEGCCLSATLPENPTTVGRIILIPPSPFLLQQRGWLPNSWNLRMCYLLWNKGICRCWLRILRMGDYLGLCGWIQCNQKALHKREE